MWCRKYNSVAVTVFRGGWGCMVMVMLVFSGGLRGWEVGLVVVVMWFLVCFGVW